MSFPFLELPLVAGAVLAWSLSAPPGPGNALIAQDAVRRGWLSGMATGMGAISADILMFLLMWLGVLRLLGAVPWLIVVLGAAGTMLMAKFAWDAVKAARSPATLDPSVRGGYAKAFLAIVTSPFNHAWWISTGSVIFSKIGPSMVVGFFGGLVLWVAVWSRFATSGARRVRRFGEIVGYVSAVVLAIFAIVVGVFTTRAAIGLWAA